MPDAFTVVEFLAYRQTKYPFGILVKPVIAEFVLHVDCDQEYSSDTDGHP